MGIVSSGVGCRRMRSSGATRSETCFSPKAGRTGGCAVSPRHLCSARRRPQASNRTEGSSAFVAATKMSRRGDRPGWLPGRLRARPPPLPSQELSCLSAGIEGAKKNSPPTVVTHRAIVRCTFCGGRVKRPLVGRLADDRIDTIPGLREVRGVRPALLDEHEPLVDRCLVAQEQQPAVAIVVDWSLAVRRLRRLKIRAVRNPAP